MSESVSADVAALTVLKHKPKQQSIPSYLLDLRSFFSEGQPSSVKHASWRSHALALESELESLKQTREEDQEELARLRQNASKDVSEDSGTNPQKKKTKKTGKVPEHPIDERATGRTRPSNAESQLPPSFTAVFTTLRSVVDSVSSRTGDDAAAGYSRLIATITRSLLAISSFLGLQNLSMPSFPHSELNNSRIAMVSPLLVYVLGVAFPALFYQGISNAISTAVSRLIDSILVPLVRSFALASRAHISHHIDAASAKKTSRGRSKAHDKASQTPSQRFIPDARMNILTLLTEALDALASISPTYSGYTAGIMERIALEAIRALESLYSTLPTVGADRTMESSAVQEEPPRGMESSQVAYPPSHKTALSRHERLEALARKDTTWYLCHILNSCASRNAMKDGSGSVLSVALLDGAAMLVKMCISMDCESGVQVRRGRGMDVVCRNMVLAVCEKIITTQENSEGPY